MLKSPFNKVAALKVCYFIKKRLQHVFSCEIAKFLRTTILKKQFQRAAYVLSVSKL